MTTPTPDIFRNVHKGIRKALCDACVALGRASAGEPSDQTARALLRDALRFVAHHGENEDLLLLPLLEPRAPELTHALMAAHQELHSCLVGLQAALERATPAELYAQACAFAAAYFQHMHDEEHVHEPCIRALLSVEELIGFAQQSVQRTAPAEQRMMLGFMLPAMTRPDVEAFLGRLPAELANQLRSSAS
jgi:Hemerythrin HHE cation binding domain